MRIVLFCVVTAATIMAVDKLDLSDSTAKPAVVNTMDLLGRSCGQLKMGGLCGSGTIGFYKGHLVVVTAGHCFDTVGEFGVLTLDRGYGKVDIRVKCVAIDRSADLALAVPLGYVPPFKYPDLTVADPERGEGYCQFSYPVGYDQLLTLGWIQRPNTPFPLGGWDHVSVVDGNAGPGSSGSAIWVKRGLTWRLAGIYVGRLSEDGWAFRNAVSSKLLREFMDGAY
jgi:hypothetical protein